MKQIFQLFSILVKKKDGLIGLKYRIGGDFWSIHFGISNNILIRIVLLNNYCLREFV